MIERVEILILEDVRARSPEVRTGPGLSMLVRLMYEDGRRISLVFDAGSSEDVIRHNITATRADLSEAIALVLSHGHWDHTGGILAVLSHVRRRPLPVVAHPDALLPRVATFPHLRYVGIPVGLSEVLRAGGIFVTTRRPLEIAPCVMTTGEIPRVTPYERAPEGYLIQRGNELAPDEILDDQALVVRLADGSAVVITGCAHSGVVNTVRYARCLTGAERVRLVVGGFHLARAPRERLVRTVDDLRRLNVERVAPIHCSGEEILRVLPEEMREDAKAGDLLVVEV